VLGATRNFGVGSWLLSVMGAVISRSGRQAPKEKNRRTQSTGNLRSYKPPVDKEALKRSPSERLAKDAAKLRAAVNQKVLHLEPLVRSFCTLWIEASTMHAHTRQQ
jgi:hypothetical protein